MERGTYEFMNPDDWFSLVVVPFEIFNIIIVELHVFEVDGVLHLPIG